MSATVTCVGGSFGPTCDSEVISVDLSTIPPPGTHLLQVASGGLQSNELPFTSQ